MDILAQLFEFDVPFVPLVKKAMILRGIDMEDVCTFPLENPTVEQVERIEGILKKLNIDIK